MKKSLFFCMALISVFIFASVGCSSSSGSSSKESDGSYTNENMPEDISVNIPNSVKDNKSGTKSRSINESGEENESQGLSMIKQMVNDEMLPSVKEIQYEMMLIDAFYNDAIDYLKKNSTTSIPAGKLTVKFTKEMAEKEIELELSCYNEDSLSAEDKKEITDEIMKSIGDEIENPEITETNINNPQADSEGYDYYLKYNDSYEEGKLVFNTKNTIKWTKDKKKVKVSRESTFTDEIYGTINDVYSIEYDADKKKMVFKANAEMGEVKYGYQSSIEEAGDKNAVKVNMAVNGDDVNGKFNFKIDAFIDDDGGYIEYNMTSEYKINGIVINESFKYKETFNGQGVLTGQEYYDKDQNKWVVNETIGGLDSGYSDESDNLSSSDEIDVKVNGLTGTESFSYVIVKSGISYDSNNSDAFFMDMLGSGYYDPKNSENNYVSFWGTAEDLAGGVTVWMQTYDYNTGNIEYSVISGASVSSIAK